MQPPFEEVPIPVDELRLSSTITILPERDNNSSRNDKEKNQMKPDTKLAGSNSNNNNSSSNTNDLDRSNDGNSNDNRPLVPLHWQQANQFLGRGAFGTGTYLPTYYNQSIDRLQSTFCLHLAYPFPSTLGIEFGYGRVTCY